MNAALLSFENIHFGYAPGGQAVLKDLSLQLGGHSITAILGPNGAGKTTLMYLALGWLKPQQGTIRLADRPLGSYSRRELGQWLGLVPQNEHIPFEFSLLEYVVLGRAPHLNALEMPGAKDCQIALDALDQVGLVDLAYRSVTSLSGGNYNWSPWQEPLPNSRASCCWMNLLPIST